MADREIDNTLRRDSEARPPKALTDILMDHISPDSAAVLITDCEQYGELLPDVIRAHPDTEFTLTTVKAQAAGELADIYGPMKNVNLIRTDILERGFTEAKFDLIISIPAFGGGLLARDTDFICRDTDLAALENLIGFLKEGGELVIVLPSRIAFGGGSIEELRKFIEDHYGIREISILPEGLFRRVTSIQTYLFVFSDGMTDSVLMRKYEPDTPIGRNSRECELVLKNEITLSKEDFEKLSGWHASRVLYEETEEKKAYDASSVRKVWIRDVATVSRGRAVSTKSTDGRIGVIGISDITDTGIDYSHIDRIDAQDRKIGKYLLEDGDVLVSTRGTTIKVAVAEEMPMKCIPSVNLIVIRTDSELLRGTYLKLFLESPVGTQMLESLQRGGSVININYKDVGSLKVPAPDIDIQDAVIRKYNDGLKRYKAAISLAEESWNKIREEVQDNLFYCD